MRRELVRLGLLFGLLLGGLPLVVSAVGFTGSLWGTTVGMTEVNAVIDTYNRAHGADVIPLSFGVGGKLNLSFPVAFLGTPYLGLRGLTSQARSTRENVSTALIGPYGGLTIELGPVAASVDVGGYWGTLSFPAAGYNDLSGWGLGLIAQLDYGVRVSSVLTAYVGVTGSWLPVNSLSDAEGGVYEARDRAFLDFSGFGLSLGVRWGK